ncbi:response regulator [Kribbella sp. NPDC049174]|uniref:response regulator n=1 Tax=Kribbella sp. NPDC049174 TaxID=3364112 RepID=UPI00370FB1C3
MIRVLLVDDQALVRAGLRALIDACATLQVVGEAGNGRQALSVGRELRPDVYLMDLKMPVMSGVEATLAIRADPVLKNVPVLVLTTFDDEDEILEVVRAGATGYLLKDIEPGELRRAIHAAARGDAVLAPAVARLLMEQVAQSAGPHERDPRIDALTVRELEVLTEIGTGSSNDEIGRALFISPQTARTYVGRLLSKLQARDRAQLIVLAHRWGLVGR